MAKPHKFADSMHDLHDLFGVDFGLADSFEFIEGPEGAHRNAAFARPGAEENRGPKWADDHPAAPKLALANEKSVVDLLSKLGDFSGEDANTDEASAKPDHPGKGNAWGKNKDKTTDGTDTTTDGTDTTTDTTTDGTDTTTDGTDTTTDGTDTTTDGTDTTTDGTDTTTDGTDTTTDGTDTTTETNTGSDDPNVYVSGLDTPDGYNVEINFIGEWSDAFMQSVIDAAEMISDLVTGDIPSHNGIDDIRIDATVTDLGGAFGRGGYTSVRSDSSLPSEGFIQLDSSGAQTVLNYGVLDDLVFHEILHSMGFGLTWNAMGLVDDYNGDLRFNGDMATEVYNTQYSGIADSDPLSQYGVPIETDGGSGTAGKHWDEATFNNEIMTGTLSTNNSISDMTVAALEDMGYDTVYGDSLLIA